MSDEGASSLVDQPTSRISHNTLLVVLWALTGLASLLFAVRIGVRLSLFRRIFLDDGFAGVALAILIANAIVTHVMAPPMYVHRHFWTTPPAASATTCADQCAQNKYEIMLVSIGRAPATSAFLERASLYPKLQFASTILFWSCLWAVKACFLAFFYKLTDSLRAQRKMLWVVVVVTVLSYVGAVITYPVSCTSFVLGVCQTPLNVERSLISLRYSTAVDIITDIMIIAIPVSLCWRVRISMKQKIGLYSVLCLGVVVVLFSIVRIIVTNTDNVHPEISWLALWSSIESSVAIIVASLVSFKALLTQRSRAVSGRCSGNRYYQKYGQGVDPRSGAEGRMGQDSQMPDDHEMNAVASVDRSAEGHKAAAKGKQGVAVSEVSVELRQTSFESEEAILRKTGQAT